MFVWSMILISYIVFRRRRPAPARGLDLQDARLRLHAVRGARVLRASCWWRWGRPTTPGWRCFVAPVWFLLLGAAWHFNRKSPLQQARIVEWKAVRSQPKTVPVAGLGRTRLPGRAQPLPELRPDPPAGQLPVRRARPTGGPDDGDARRDGDGGDPDHRCQREDAANDATAPPSRTRRTRSPCRRGPARRRVNPRWTSPSC